MKYNVLIIFILIIACTSKTDSFKSEQDEYNKRAILLGDSAVNILYDVMYDHNIPDSIISKSLSMINQAISLEPRLYALKHHKLMMLSVYNRNSEALLYLDSLYCLNNNSFEIVNDQANIYKHMNNKEEAICKYKEAINILEKQMLTDSLDLEKFLVKTILILSTEDTLQAVKYFQENKNKYNDSTNKIKDFQNYFDFIFKKGIK
jgi:tetratricopeptide (TPR) repeat protein